MPTNPLRWLYDYRSMRYRDLATGRFVSSKQVRIWAQDALNASTDRIVSLAEMVSTDRLTVTEWERAMRLELKNEYIAQYLAGRGGVHRMTQADWGSVGGQLSEAFSYLSNFARQIAGGNLTQGQIIARARMYINSAREAFERAQGRSAKDAGLTMVHWHLTDIGPRGFVEHCPDCLLFESMGWRDAGPEGGFVMPGGEETVPGTGSTICLTNCLCYLEHGSAQMALG